jgi:hypothetical protein
VKENKAVAVEFLNFWLRPLLAPVLVGMMSAYITGNIAIARLEERLIAVEKRTDRVETKQSQTESILLDVHKGIAELKGIIMAGRR